MNAGSIPAGSTIMKESIFPLFGTIQRYDLEHMGLLTIPALFAGAIGLSFQAMWYGTIAVLLGIEIDHRIKDQAEGQTVRDILFRFAGGLIGIALASALFL